MVSNALSPYAPRNGENFMTLKDFKNGDIVKFKSGIGKIQDHLLIELISDTSMYVKVVKAVDKRIDATLELKSDFNLLERVSPTNYNRRKVQFKYVKV